MDLAMALTTAHSGMEYGGGECTNVCTMVSIMSGGLATLRISSQLKTIYSTQPGRGSRMVVRILGSILYSCWGTNRWVPGKGC